VGSAAVLPCLASGFPVPEISWSKVSRDAGTRGCGKAGMGAQCHCRHSQHQVAPVLKIFFLLFLSNQQIILQQNARWFFFRDMGNDIDLRTLLFMYAFISIVLLVISWNLGFCPAVRPLLLLPKDVLSAPRACSCSDGNSTALLQNL